MNFGLSLRAALLQALAVAALFALLVALPLPEDFFRRSGSVVGPVAWLGCALLSGRLLSLTLWRTLAAALASGLCAVGVGMALSHTAGLVAAVIVFGAVCGARLGTTAEQDGRAASDAPASGA